MHIIIRDLHNIHAHYAIITSFLRVFRISWIIHYWIKKDALNIKYSYTNN